MTALTDLYASSGVAPVLLIIGLVILAISGDFLVQAAASLAAKLRIPDMVIGLTVVAFGTSAPELLVALKSVWVGEAQLALGAVIGSNIANILLVLGVPAIIAGTSCMQPMVRRNYGFMLAVTVLFIGFCLTGMIDFVMGAILFGLLILFILVSLFRARDVDPTLVVGDVVHADATPDIASGRLIVLLLIGLIGLPLGANLTVDGALGVADSFALPKEAVGLVILALGTSLPELAAATAAAWRRESGLIIGSVLGSNIFNILSIIGITAMVAELPVGAHITRIDVWIMLAATLLLGPFVMRRATITRFAGLVFVLLYGLFVYVELLA